MTALAGAAGSTLVTLLTTEGWQRVKDAFTIMWRRHQPERVDAVAAELGSTRDDLLAAQTSGDRETPAELEAEWQGRVRRLLGAHPEAAEGLRAVLAELGQAGPTLPSVTQHASVSGHARVYQAGRDLNYGQQ
ncbi:hypothetical protein [Streptomyces sp. NBC_01497]|uniref:hypothetical protein n=1 Tax=Streptomyces sp. NBC_01497 TaxID=2903885 RepID=UPI002E31FB64|nr:hypothetical protein [Streptomyces sp. NBC_01497]